MKGKHKEKYKLSTKYKKHYVNQILITVELLSGNEKVGLRKDRRNIKLWIQNTFDTVMKIIDKG